ncbi:MAG: hypothetical protein ACTSQG_10305 [Promethearchaeota archaeon]
MDLLFCRNGELSKSLEGQKKSLINEIENLDRNYILNVSEEDLIQFLLSKYSPEPPEIKRDKIYQEEPREVDIDVSQDYNRMIRDRSKPYYMKGTEFTFVIPFDGAKGLFHFQPSQFTLNPPIGEIQDQAIRISFRTLSYDSNEVKKIKNEFNKQLSEISKYLEWVKNDLDDYNNSIENIARQVISNKKKKHLDELNMAEAIGVPIKKREDTKSTYVVPTVRRKPIIERPVVKEKGFKPEPILSLQDYEYILDVIKNMAIVMERSPKAFINTKEEDLRNHFLVQLNGHFEGQATGETFNFSGKTDILIRYEGRNVFIAECKFWEGDKKFLETIDQLLGYLSWRDTKTAIIIFNRKKDFSKVLSKILEVVKTHACYKPDINIKEDTVFRYVFHQQNDTNRELYLTVMAFDVPK